MKSFNAVSRTKNAYLNSSTSIIYQIYSIVISFVFRTLFIKVLSEQYLGINGLFTNVLTILSVADLGISATIVFRLYKPIAENTPEKVAQYMRFFRDAYRIIACAILVLGLSIIPFLKYLIKDMSEVPSDVNIYLVYGLFLLQSVSSYLFSYKTTLITADQKGYVLSLVNIVIITLLNALKIGTLYLSKNFTLVLAVGIVFSLFSNAFLNLLTTKMYPFVFEHKNKLDKGTIKEIAKETKVLMYHKIGGTVITGANSILLSSMIGIGVLGIYSNYSMIILSVNALLLQGITAIGAGIGNLRAKSPELLYRRYKDLQYLNLFLAIVCTVAVFNLINPFITVWLGESLTFGKDSVMIVAAISGSFFCTVSRSINSTFINSCGLFVKDRYRPIIEIAVNLISSIALGKLLGIVGIFLGTIISSVTVVMWREPYLLYKFEFKRKSSKYHLVILFTIALTVALSALMYYICGFFPNTWQYVILKFLLCGVIPPAILIALTFWTKEFKYFYNLIKNLVLKIFKRKSKNNI